MKVHILDDWFDTLRHLPCFDLLSDHQVVVWNDHQDDVNILANRLHDAQALVLFRERTKITRALLERLPNLKLISQRSVYPHIDVDACNDHQVLLCSNLTSDTPCYAAAELTWALILNCQRQLPAQIASLKQGQWQMGVGKTLRGRTLGLWGFGRIARQVARYAQAFDMKVIWWGSEQGRENALNEGYQVALSREKFFSECDVISIHVRLKENTRNMINEDDLAKMKPSAVFVNTSRSQLITSGAILNAADRGRPGMIAIDVFDNEPNTNVHDPLLNHARIIATPHIGYVTEDEFNHQFTDIFKQINAYALGEPIHMINPQVYSSGFYS